MKRPLSMKFRELLDTHRKNEYALKPYLIRDSKPHPVAIICPGGGYRRVCSFVEGHPFAKALNRMGCHAVVVYYRVREKALFPTPQDDLARAVREVLAKAQEWHLDMDGYSVWGSSAGGHLAASFGTESMGYPKYGLPRPGALVLVYPVVTMGEKTHSGSRANHLGAHPSAEEINRASVENHVTNTYPPTFLWWGDSDASVHPDNSRMLQKALVENNIPCLCREYPGVGHGVGLGKGLACEGWIGDAVKFWLSQRA